MRIALFLTTILFFASSFEVKAQPQIDDQYLIWLRYVNRLHLTEKLSMHTTLEERRYVDPDRIHQRFLPQVSLNYAASERVEYNIGGTYFLAYTPNDPTIEAVKNVEIRPHQFVKIKNNFGRFGLSQRYMTEERFFMNNPAADNPFVFNFRVRLLTVASYTLKENMWNNKSGKWKLIAYDEIMFQVGEGIKYNLFDQNRLFFGTQIDFGKRLGLEVGIFNWFQQLPGPEQFVSRYIGRVTLFHNINLR